MEGCCHGELDAIYATVQAVARRGGRPIDLLICCGDFQAVRNLDDLECMACPPKYRSMASFWKYYAGLAVAPVPTLFIGGNHEAANHLWELPFGGWVAPRIFYLGDAGVVRFGGLRIAGLSGIFNGRHVGLGRYERPPYSPDSVRSAYHVRALDAWRLRALATRPDVMLSHDWPRGIARHGDMPALFARKPFLKREVLDGSLGSPVAEDILRDLQPAYWFSAHMHTKFAAVVRHSADAWEEGSQGGDGADLDVQPSNDASTGDTHNPALPPHGQRITRFLALDKCLPRRQFLQVVDFPEAQGPKQFCFDAEWAAALRVTWDLNNWARRPSRLPGGRPPRVTPEEVALAAALLRDNLVRDKESAPELVIPDNFAPMAPAYDPQRPARGRMPQTAARSPQTLQYLAALGLQLDDEGAHAAVPSVLCNPEEIDLEDDDNLGAPDIIPALASVLAHSGAAANPEEIDLDDSDDANA